MSVIGIDLMVADRIARVFKGIEKEGYLDVFDQRFYPPAGDPPEDVFNYFLAMVAIDHRTSSPGKPYSAEVGGEVYRGSDLLYRLGRMKYEEDPSFFSPRKLAGIKIDEVKSWLAIGDIEPRDLEGRAMLLRDLGEKLLKLYGSSSLLLLEISGGRMRGSLGSPGLSDLLRPIRAYEDPVEKKANLLAKFLSRRGLFSPPDAGIPVDNHLVRIAYRVGLVMVSGELWNKIKEGGGVTREEDVLARLVVKEAYEYAARKSGRDPFSVDDFLWVHGRTICRRDDAPLCERCYFKGFCKARRNPAFMVREHYFDTWYY